MTNKTRLLNASLMLLFAVHLNCAAHTPLNPAQVLEFPISKGGLTRISVENDGIEDIYAYPTEYADNISHHKSGHVFVVSDDLEGPFYVTLITKRGVAQDLKLIPKSKKTEPILLHFEETSTPAKVASLQDSCAETLSHFIGGIVPIGYTPTTVNEVSRGSGTHLTVSAEGPEMNLPEAILEKAYQNDVHRVLIFKVKNESTDKITLDNKVYWGEGDLASVFDQPTLKSQESARLYVIQKR